MVIPDISLRHAVVEDADALSTFMNSLANENLDTITGLRPSPTEEKEYIEKAAKNGRAFFMVALSGNDIVGVLDLWAGDKPHNRHVARLGTSVLADYRCRGIGRRLLRYAISEAAAWPGFCRIELDVVPWNAAAIRLYQSEGFVHEGTKRKATNIAGKMADLNLMALVW